MTRTIVTCWSVDQQMHTATHDAVIHLANGPYRTRCGIAITERWESDVADSPDEVAVGCLRCRKYLAQEHDNGSTTADRPTTD